MSDNKDILSILALENININDFSHDEIANIINDCFLDPQQSYVPLDESDKIQYAGPASNCDILRVDEFDVFMKLKSLNASKSPGPDGLQPWLLREFAEILAYPICQIINNSFQQGKLPLGWKQSNISPIPKASQITDINKHLRPISLTPIISKVAEDFVIERQFKPAVLEIIDKNQYGVVPRSSTTMALISMMHHWLQATDQPGNLVRTILFDFRKAFDLIDHKRLSGKIKQLNLPAPTTNWILDFLTGRKQRVKLTSNCFSQWSEIRAGVPQGTKLGPWLYVLMINDLTTSHSDPWKFVDDTTISEILKKGQRSVIQLGVNEVQNWTETNLAQLNDDKCKELRIDFSRISNTSNTLVPILVNGKELEIVNNAKILGLTISSDLKWRVHVETIVSKATKRLYLITQLKRAKVPIEDIILIYCACIRSILEYASPVFHNSLPKYLINEIERVQKRFLRRVYPNLSYEDAIKTSKLDLLFDRRTAACLKLFEEAQMTDHKLHSLVPEKKVCSYSLRQCSKFHLPRIRTDRYKNSFIIANSLQQ
jgi:hypothetical protein